MYRFGKICKYCDVEYVDIKEEYLEVFFLICVIVVWLEEDYGKVYLYLMCLELGGF